MTRIKPAETTILKSITRLIRWSAILSLVATLGCGLEDESHVEVHHMDGVDALPPQQVRRALEQLSANDARQQSIGLEFVESFPSLTETHRRLIERLAKSGASTAVKKKANALLDP